MRKLRRRKEVNYVDATVIPKDIFKGKRKKRRSVKNIAREHVPVEDIHKLCPGTPTYKTTFQKIKYKKTKELFNLLIIY